MPRQPAQGSLKPLTSFSFAPPSFSTNDRAAQGGTAAGGASLSGAKGKGKERAREDGEGVEQAESRVGRLGEPGEKRQEKVFKPLTSFARPPPAPPALAQSAVPKPKAAPKQLNPLAPPPPRPSSASNSAAKAPPQKRQKRVLATQDELEAWGTQAEKEKRKADKGKGRAAPELEEEGEGVMGDGTGGKKPKAAFRPLASNLGVFSPAPKSTASRAKAGTPSRPAHLPQPLHSLSAMSPFSTFSATPLKPAMPSPAMPVTKLFGQLPTPVKRDEDDKKPVVPAKSILAMQPPAPSPAMAGEEVEMGDGSQGLSPGKKGKKGGFLLSGIASRASNLLNVVKTEQGFWLHDLSRSIASLDLPAPIPSLLEVAPPALRLTVLSVLDSSTIHGEFSIRDGKRTLLAQCRLELDEPSPFPASSPFDQPSSPHRDLVGLVLFSLHSYSSTNAAPPVSPVKPRTAKEKAKDDGRRSLYIPTNPHDLERFISRGGGEGVQVWVYEPFYPVDLLSEQVIGETPRPLAEVGGLKEADEELVGEGVEWDEELERKREEERRRAKDAERRKKALVVGRFAVLV
ncbi:hypothetical protein JCM10213_003128 [Rhodosporidiobolus nylandii]